MEDDYPGHALALLVATGVDLDAPVGAVGQGVVSIDGAATIPRYTSTVPGGLPVAMYFTAGGDSVDLSGLANLAAVHGGRLRYAQ